MNSTHEGYAIAVRLAVDAGPGVVSAQVYDRYANAVGGEVPVATWDQVELLEARYHVQREATHPDEEARAILDKNSGTMTA